MLEKLRGGSVFEVLLEECESVKQSGEGSSWGRPARALGTGLRDLHFENLELVKV